MMSAISVKTASAEDATRWDLYAHQRGGFFHRFGWATAIEQTYGHGPHYLYAEQGGQICGILPLIDRKSFLFGRALISTAFTVGGGIIADNEDVKDQLASQAMQLGADLNADYIELRSTSDKMAGWHEKHGIYDNFSTQIIPDPDERLKAIPRKKRADIRKSIKSAAEGNIEAMATDDLDLFWHHYAIAQRGHGTPVFPRHWLQAQKKAFGDDMEVCLVMAEGRPVCGVVSYYEKDRVLLYNSFISDDARRFHAGDFLYWWMMGHAADRGVATFDLGRSKRGTGSHAYKTYWGFVPQPMVYLYKLMHAEDMPNVNPQNPKFALMTKVWSRLPMPVVNQLGPFVARHLA